MFPEKPCFRLLCPEGTFIDKCHCNFNTQDISSEVDRIQMNQKSR